MSVLRGRDGAPGHHGERGYKGEEGVQGPMGPQGIQGPRGPSSSGGTVYVRWGRTVCPNTCGTQLMYKGLAVGTRHDKSGGASTYLCTVEDPDYLTEEFSQATTPLYGAEYQSPVGFSNELLDYSDNVPCAVCYTERSSKFMIPGKVTCPQSWTIEYIGYLMTEFSDHARNLPFECVDKDAEAVPGEAANTNGALFYHVGAECGVGLPCPAYEAYRPITCVVCTK